MTFSIDLRSEDVVIKWLGELPPTLRRYLPDGLKKGGKLLTDTAQRLTQQEDAIGSTRDYLEGWKFEPEDIRDDGAVGFLYNDADHAFWAEHGRGVGGMPPQDAIEDWMQSRGLPQELSFVIRRAIAQRGTVKRKGYKGFEIMERTLDMVRDDVLDELDYALQRALRSMA
jgi:hypothetical protein